MNTKLVPRQVFTILCLLSLLLHHVLALPQLVSVNSTKDLTVNHAWSHTGQNLNTTETTPDLSYCTLRPSTSPSEWLFSGPRARQFPPPQDSISSTLSVIARREIDTPPPSTVHRSQLSSTPCLEINRCRINSPPTVNGGYIRLNRIDLPLDDSDYWLIWHFETPIIITSYVRYDVGGLLEKETLERSSGPSTWAKKYRGGPGREVFIDLSLSPEGGNGTMSVWQMLNRLGADE